MSLVFWVSAPADSRGYTVQLQAAGETIELEIQPVPPGRVVLLNGTTNCYLDTGSYYCSLILWDPSWTSDFTMSAKITPQGPVSGPSFWLSYYYDAVLHYGYTLDSRACPGGSKCTLNPSVQFLMPDYAKQFVFDYDSGAGTRIFVTIDVAYSDGRSAGVYGGPAAHDDVLFCGRSGQPGKPKRIAFRRDKGGGPGG